jgi:hypothetical protein
MPRVRLDFMVEPRYTVKALDQSTWTAFAVLVERNNGIFGGCWCLGFHPQRILGPTWRRNVLRRNSESERAKPTPRSFSTERTASAGASSAHPTKCPGSRTGRRTRKAGRPRQTGESRAAMSVRGSGVRAWPPRARRCARSHRGPGRGDCRGIPGGRQLGARRLPLQRRLVDLREARIHL